MATIIKEKQKGITWVTWNRSRQIYTGLLLCCDEPPIKILLFSFLCIKYFFLSF